MKKQGKQLDMFKAETTWFHVFKAMIEDGDVAKMGPHALTVYVIIKAYTNWKTGRSFPGVELIAEKSGISKRKVLSTLKVLTEAGYLTKKKEGRKNVYTLREKVTLKDLKGEDAALATWDYLPSAVEAARAELKKFKTTGLHEGQHIHIENLNIQIITGTENQGYQIMDGSNLEGLDENTRKIVEKYNKKAQKIINQDKKQEDTK